MKKDFILASGEHNSDLILRSGLLAASRRMAASPFVYPAFETLASQAPQDEVSILYEVRP
jgi:hypothetical protein